MCYTETIKVNNLSQLVYLKVNHRVTLFLSKLSGIRPQVKFPGKWGLPLRYKLFSIWRYFTWDLLKTFHPLSHQHILRWYGDHNPVHDCVLTCLGEPGSLQLFAQTTLGLVYFSSLLPRYWIITCHFLLVCKVLEAPFKSSYF